MNERSLSRVILIWIAVGFSACTDVSTKPEVATYDDCIIETVSNAPNSDAIELLKSSCARKFEQDIDLQLEVKQAVSSTTEIQISNQHDFIVTEFRIDAGDLGDWSVEEWIEPKGFSTLETPENSSEISSAAKSGEVIAKATRAIPVAGGSTKK